MAVASHDGDGACVDGFGIDGLGNMMQDLLATAIEMHRTGQLATAVQLYQAVLAVERENADALAPVGRVAPSAGK